MKLYIDTSNHRLIKIGLDGKIYKKFVNKRGAENLIFFIGEILKKEGKSIKDISEIKVNTGPGSYTGLKVGVAVANALGWALSIPVNGKKIEERGVVKIKYK